MKYFSLNELIRSDTANRLGIDNKPSIEVEEKLINLVERVLDPLREWYGKPIIINSGYRNERVNKAVGGASKSQHLSGEAADITTRDKTENKKLFNYIKDNLEFDQLIDEKNFSWVHVSFKDNNRKQVLKL